MNLKKALAQYEEREISGEVRRYYKPENLGLGLCVYCDNELYHKGQNIVNCEYHYLKHKYRSFSDRCRLAKETSVTPAPYPSYKKIRCKFIWKEFLEWCIENKKYRKMNEPYLIRINTKGHFEFDNIKWFEAKPIIKSKSTKKPLKSKRK
jgi:hypothetical protein